MGKNKERLNSHNIDLSAILSGINNLPPAGGEDLTETVNNQTTAVEELMKMVSRKIAMNNGEGQFVWKKIKEYTFDPVITESNGKYIVSVTNANFDTASVDISFFVGFEWDCYVEISPSLTNTMKIKNIDGDYCLQWGDTNSICTGGTYDKTARQFSFTDTGFDRTIATTQAINEKVDFVVSSDAEAYPNGGEKDGYWYELVEEEIDLPFLAGCTKIAIDKVVYSSRTAGGGMISHSLGEVPKIALLFCTSRSIVNYDVTASIIVKASYGNASYGVNIYGYSSDGSILTSNALQNTGLLSATEVKAVINSSIYYTAGVEYTLITMA